MSPRSTSVTRSTSAFPTLEEARRKVRPSPAQEMSIQRVEIQFHEYLKHYTICSSSDNKIIATSQTQRVQQGTSQEPNIFTSSSLVTASFDVRGSGEDGEWRYGVGGAGRCRSARGWVIIFSGGEDQGQRGVCVRSRSYRVRRVVRRPRVNDKAREGEGTVPGVPPYSMI